MRATVLGNRSGLKFAKSDAMIGRGSSKEGMLSETRISSAHSILVRPSLSSKKENENPPNRVNDSEAKFSWL